MAKNEAQQVGQEFSKPSSLHCIKTFSKLKSALGYVSSICVTDDDWGQLRADVNQFNGMAAAVKEAPANSDDDISRGRCLWSLVGPTFGFERFRKLC